MNKKKFLSMLSLVALVCAFFAPPTASAQVTPRNTTTLTLSSTSFTISTAATCTSSTFSINPTSGFAVIPTFFLGASGTGNVVFTFQVSTDGSTWVNTNPLTCSFSATGTTSVVGFYNFAPRQLGTSSADNIAYGRMSTFTSSNSGTTSLSSVVISRNN